MHKTCTKSTKTFLIHSIASIANYLTGDSEGVEWAGVRLCPGTSKWSGDKHFWWFEWSDMEQRLFSVRWHIKAYFKRVFVSYSISSEIPVEGIICMVCFQVLSSEHLLPLCSFCKEPLLGDLTLEYNISIGKWSLNSQPHCLQIWSYMVGGDSVRKSLTLGCKIVTPSSTSASAVLSWYLHQLVVHSCI